MLIFFHYLGWLSAVEYFTRSLLIPVATTFQSWRSRISDYYLLPRERLAVTQSLENCRSNQLTGQTILAKNKILEEENAQLKKQLDFKRRSSGRMVTSDVIGANMDNSGNTILINAGTLLGIGAGDPVIAGEGVLVGVISKVEDEISIVRLINHNQSKIAATLLNRDRSLGVVEGGFGISVRMNFIPRNETIMIGDQVVTSGLEQRIPRGLLIGEVAASENEAYQPFQQAVLTPLVDMAKLTVVSVLITH